MLGSLVALLTDGGSVFISVEHVEIELVEALLADFAVHILKLIVLLHPVLNGSALPPTELIDVGDLADFILAQGARVLNLFDPLLDAWIAEDVKAGVKLGVAIW